MNHKKHVMNHLINDHMDLMQDLPLRRWRRQDKGNVDISMGQEIIDLKE